MLKEKYDFDLQTNKILKPGLDSLKDLLSTSPNMRTLLQNQLKVLRNLIFHSFNNKEMINHLKIFIRWYCFFIRFFQRYNKRDIWSTF